MKLPLLASNLLSKEVKNLVKVGYLSEDLKLTDKGKRILDTILFSKYMKEMVAQARTILKEQEAEQEQQEQQEQAE